jgi:hypothetical protein
MSVTGMVQAKNRLIGPTRMPHLYTSSRVKGPVHPVSQYGPTQTPDPVKLSSSEAGLRSTGGSAVANRLSTFRMRAKRATRTTGVSTAIGSHYRPLVGRSPGGWLNEYGDVQRVPNHRICCSGLWLARDDPVTPYPVVPCVEGVPPSLARFNDLCDRDWIAVEVIAREIREPQSQVQVAAGACATLLK